MCDLRVLLLLSLVIFAAKSAEIGFKDEISALAEQIEFLKSAHKDDVSKLLKEVDELKASVQPTSNHDRNEQETLEWARKSMNELRAEVKELADNVNNSELLQQLHIIRNELKQALSEAADLAQLARTQEARVDKLDNELGRLRHDDQQTRTLLAELRSHVGKLAKEIKTKQLEEMNDDSYNEVVEVHALRHGGHRARINIPHRLRHSKMLHSQIARLSRSQDQLDEYQQTLQTQILDVQRRLDRVEVPNWNLLSAKVDFLELENRVIREELQNLTVQVSDLDKVHASMLELREDLESIENKADKTVPEFRKEISKLEVNVAQVNAQSSYLKEGQEHLRQSVKAIAVSISNTIDRAEMDHQLLKKLNESVDVLQSHSKQHFHRLNDHILKSETNRLLVSNLNETKPLPELIGQVKELQPVKREYEDLVNQLPKDCSAVVGPAGVYMIHPDVDPIDAWCVNGSTLLQRRYNGSVEFNRKFQEYATGFGDPDGEYWLGLETMHQLTADNCSSMRIDMTDIYGGEWYAHYDYFSVGNRKCGYVLNVAGFTGNASDAFAYQNHMEFSTIDNDRDISNTHCAGNYEGGWWYSHCQHVNINGRYTLGLTWFDSARNEWIAVATSEMRMYRRKGCS